MKAQLLKVPVPQSVSFSVRRDVVPYFLNRWHFHPEIELILIESGHGTQYVGDNISEFEEGDLLLIGSNLPHYWRCDDEYFYGKKDLNAKALVIHFMKDFWGRDFLELPENKHIKELLFKAQRGIKIGHSIKGKVQKLMERCLLASSSEKIPFLLQMLAIVAEAEGHVLLASEVFRPEFDQYDSERINNVYAYALANYKNKISLEEIASIANVSPHSFCRYFKTKTKKNFSRFLQEIRVGCACKLLIENRLTIMQVCYESGFNNFANFHRYFKQITGKTPSTYQKEQSGGGYE